jgi:uncharacterized FlaG/YvyC family protein
MRNLVQFLVLLLAAPLMVSSAPPLVKAQVADLIRKVENGVDEFRNYLERKGDSARERSSTAQQTTQTRRRGSSTANTEARKAQASQTKDELNEALDAINRSTNRLRRKFDATDTWMETKVQVEAVVDDGRRINQAVTRGNYGSDVARLWATLRTGINDLARAYGVAPLGV